MPLALEERKTLQTPRGFMKANVFQAPGQFGLAEKPIPRAGTGEAVIQVRLTTICGTDVHIIRGEYPIEPGTTIGHEAVGVIHELGAGVTGYEVGQRVLVGAITPCAIEPCLGGARLHRHRSPHPARFDDADRHPARRAGQRVAAAGLARFADRRRPRRRSLWLIAEAYYRWRAGRGHGHGRREDAGDDRRRARLARRDVTPSRSCSGALVGAAMMSWQKDGMRYALPFGTFLSVGALAASLVGEPILTWYLSFYP